MKTKNSLILNVSKTFSVVSLFFLFSCTKSPLREELKATMPIEANSKKTTNSISPLALCYANFNRYYSSNYTDHYYTTTLGNYQFYVFEKVECQISGCSNTGSLFLPLYQYYSVSQRDHYYTRTQGNYAGYVYEQIAGYVLNAPDAGSGFTLPLYQFYNSSQGDHFYTVTYGTYAGYTYEAVVGYVHP